MSLHCRHLFGSICLLILAISAASALSLSSKQLSSSRFEGWAIISSDCSDTGIRQVWRQRLYDLPKDVEGYTMVSYNVQTADSTKQALQTAQALTQRQRFHDYIARGFALTTEKWFIARGQQGIITTVRGIAHSSQAADVAHRAVIYTYVATLDQNVVWFELSQVVAADDLKLVDRAIEHANGKTMADEMAQIVVALWENDTATGDHFVPPVPIAPIEVPTPPVVKPTPTDTAKPAPPATTEPAKPTPPTATKPSEPAKPAPATTVEPTKPIPPVPPAPVEVTQPATVEPTKPAHPAPAEVSKPALPAPAAPVAVTKTPAEPAKPAPAVQVEVSKPTPPATPAAVEPAKPVPPVPAAPVEVPKPATPAPVTPTPPVQTAPVDPTPPVPAATTKPGPAEPVKTTAPTASQPLPGEKVWQIEDKALTLFLPEAWSVSGKSPFVLTGIANVTLRVYLPEQYQNLDDFKAAIQEFIDAQREISVTKKPFTKQDCHLDGAEGVVVRYTNYAGRTTQAYYLGKAGRLWRIDIEMPGDMQALPEGIQHVLERMHIQ